MKKIAVGLTGASGSTLANSVIKQLLDAGHEVHFVATQVGEKVLSYELETPYATWLSNYLSHPHFIKYDNTDLFGQLASGSYSIDAMVIVPCSMGTLGKIAHGISDTLIIRAADVALKEKRPLVLVTRETPLSGIHLQNMLTLTQNGATILPPVPAYYNRPTTVEEIVTQTAARVLLSLGIKSESHRVWGEAHA